MTTDVQYLTDKVGDGVPLTLEEVEAVNRSVDLIAIGSLGECARRQRHGDRITFLRVADVTSDGLPDGWVPPDEAGEVRIVGMPPAIDRALAVTQQVSQTCGDRPLSGFSLSHLSLLAQRECRPLTALLGDLRSVGLDLVAEAPVDELPDIGTALSAAAEAGLSIERLTVTRCESDHSQFWQVRDLLRRHERLRVFAPLPRSIVAGQPSTGYGDLKRVALARLIVDNVATIQVDWSLYGPKLAQVALAFGADDVDAVSPSKEGGRRAPREEICRNIRAASLVPIERNGRFETLNR